jgi:hypothetical protein
MLPDFYSARSLLDPAVRKRQRKYGGTEAQYFHPCFLYRWEEGALRSAPEGINLSSGFTLHVSDLTLPTSASPELNNCALNVGATK